MQNTPRIILADAANSLSVSPTVLNRWLDEFGEFFLEDKEDSVDAAMLSEADISTLEGIKKALNDGHSFEQVRQLLRNKNEHEETPVSPDVLSSESNETAITTLGYFSEIVDELHKGQLSVLNSQSANRELMGVLIQDNFNLKEENQRLRERMLDVERRLSQIQRDEITRREHLRVEIESKLSEIRMQVLRNPVTVLQERTGCLSGLLGSRTKTVKLNDNPTAKPSQQRPPRPPGPPE